jgi:D-glycero-D-manno-heptose 1,7-bisphosphate phosphatase
MGIGDLSSRAAVFLDRDGVINLNVLDARTGEYGAPLSARDFKLVPGAISALKTLQQAQFPLFLVSNQPNFAKGKTTLEALAAIHNRLETELRAESVVFTGFYYCYHHPKGVVEGFSGACECRKPSPYFLLKARDAFNIALEKSWMVGDRSTDIECGRAAGARTIRVLEDHPAVRRPEEGKANFEAEDLAEAARIILENKIMVDKDGR